MGRETVKRFVMQNWHGGQGSIRLETGRGLRPSRGLRRSRCLDEAVVGKPRIRAQSALFADSRGQTVYLPAYFQESRPEVLHALMRARPLATLVTLSDSGLVANHIPIETHTEPAPHGMLRGHVARANPLWKEYRAGSEALAIFQGPQVYISPSFYPSKRETGEVVPTWDYAVVHAHGTLRFVQDAAWLKTLVVGLTDAHEASRRVPWKVADAPPLYIEKMLSLIVGFEFSIGRLTGKWKLSQNHTAANRQGVVQGLREAAGEDSREIADMLSAFNNEPRD
jgi:transcriptional regulator